MPMVLNEEQNMLRDTARDFIQSNAPVGLVRQLRDNNSPTGYSDTVWEQMIEMGWPAVAIDEDNGGLGFGYIGLGALLEQTGQTLANSPLFSTVVLGASIISLGGTAKQKSQWLPEIATGKLTLAVALDESNHHDPASVSLSAKQEGDKLILNGHKQFVNEAGNAQKLIVSVRTSDSEQSQNGISLVMIDPKAAGLTITKTGMIDSRNYAKIEFKNVSVSANEIIGETDKAFSALEKALDIARICMAAEMIGQAQTLFDKTVEYLKDREQFGVKIGSFQALQHRAADMYTELELTKSVVKEALSAIDENRADLQVMASLTKVRANETCRLIADEAVQMHGGIGLTDELDVGFFLKRSRVCIHSLGDSGYHKDRYARLHQI